MSLFDAVQCSVPSVTWQTLNILKPCLSEAAEARQLLLPHAEEHGGGVPLAAKPVQKWCCKSPELPGMLGGLYPVIPHHQAGM